MSLRYACRVGLAYASFDAVHDVYGAPYDGDSAMTHIFTIAKYIL